MLPDINSILKKPQKLLSPTQHMQTSVYSTKTTPLFSYISPLTNKDKSLIKKTVLKFRPNSKNYEDSWGYVIQATRYGGFKWYDSDTESLIFFGRKSSNDNTLVVPSFFAQPNYLASTVNKVQETLKVTKTILKNVSPNNVEKFQTHGFRPYKKNEVWCTAARFDDQTYPYSIVDLKKTLELKGKEYHHLRKALRKNPNAIIRKYRKKDKEDVLEIFALRDGNSSNSEKKVNGMFYVSHAMYPSADIDKFVIIDKNTNQTIGFTATSEITPNSSAFIALVFKPGIKIASIWGIFQTLGITYQKGFQTINFGGSETEGTDTFVKRNFRPMEQIKKTHLVYDP